MLPFNMSFRRMVFKYIPQIKAEDLDRHEGLIAFRHKVIQERKIIKDTSKSHEHNYKQTTKEANSIIAPYQKLFTAVQKLYSAKKQYAQQQGNFQQIPSSREGLGYLVKAAANYRWVQLKTAPVLWGNLAGYFIKNFWGLLIIIIILVYFPIKFMTMPPGTPSTSPVVSDIPGQTVIEGGSFGKFSLDDFVSDSNHAVNEINWTYSGNTELSVIIDAARTIAVLIPNPEWNGSELIEFTATDPLFASDSDTARFTVTPLNDAPQINLASSIVVRISNLSNAIERHSGILLTA